jgi:hypothetical protein
MASVGCDGCEAGGCNNCVGLLQGPVEFYPTFISQMICEVMGIHEGKPIEEVYIYPDIISSKILQGIGYKPLLTTNKCSVNIYVKGIPEASIVLAVHFWI